MALTLLEMAKTADEPTSAVIEVYAQETDLLAHLPFETITGLAYPYNQEQSLPSVGFRGLNEAFSEATGVINPQVETLAIAGGDLDVDVALVNAYGPARRARETMMKVKSLSHSIGHNLIKGDTATTQKGIDGLQKRCVGSQLVAAGATSGGDALSLYLLDKQIRKTYGATHMLMSTAMAARFAQAARTTTVGGYITFQQDNFGRQQMVYGNLPILIADRVVDVNSSLAFDESNPGGGSAVGTSVYILGIGPGLVSGIQSAAPRVTDLGEQNAKPVYRTRVEWLVGMVIEHPYCASRIYGIKDAAIVA